MISLTEGEALNVLTAISVGIGYAKADGATSTANELLKGRDILFEAMKRSFQGVIPIG